MELQFEDNEYYLVDENNDTIATTDKILLKKYDGYMKKLSKQNCDEIFGVVDVEMLAESHAEECYERNGDPLEESYFENRKYNFKEGYNKAMELNKDKLFTVEDLYRAFLINSSGNNTTLRNFFVQTVLPMFEQPKEIEVEIVVHVDLAATPTDSRHPDAYLGTDTGIPFLDENGCLILTKKK